MYFNCGTRLTAHGTFTGGNAVPIQRSSCSFDVATDIIHHPISFELLTRLRSSAIIVGFSRIPRESVVVHEQRLKRSVANFEILH